MTRRPILTPAEQRKAMSLYRGYKTDTREYRVLAESHGVNTGELNAYCWEVQRAERDRKSTQSR